MNEELAQVMQTIIACTDTISTLEGIRDRLGNALTSKELDVLSVATQIYYDERARNLAMIGVGASGYISGEEEEDEEGAEIIQQPKPDEKIKDSVPQRDQKQQHQKNVQKTAPPTGKKKTEEYPD